ncbi:MAG TPA: type IV pilus twitching motility protein PilT [Thermoanaerobaculia bacterium]|nr:type IV pilus twitching motility protein PilT [Thermoanaerobaculia bacterium]
MSRWRPLLDAFVRSRADEMRFVPGEKIFIVRQGQRLDLGREPLAVATIESLVAEIPDVPALAVGKFPLVSGFEAFAVVIERGEATVSMVVRLTERPVIPAPAPPPAPAPEPEGAGDEMPPPVAASSLDDLLRLMIERSASDLHLSSDCPPALRVHGQMAFLPQFLPLSSADVERLVLPAASEKGKRDFEEKSDADFAYEIPDLARFRVNVFRDRKGFGAVFRQIPIEIVPAETLGLSKAILELCALSKGLVLVTGPTGSGKSTTLASMIDYINRNRTDHIITIEDPVEFVHSNIKCLINQREVGAHTGSFKNALRAALREDPDIVLVGEMRDLETIAIAIETAETGHLVFGTLHTTTAVSTVDRIIDQFPPEQQEQIRVMLADALKGVVAQVLCRKIGGGRVAALEVLLVNNAVTSLIREGKTFQIPSVMQTSKAIGMTTMNDALMTLVREKLIEPREAWTKATDKTGLIGMFKNAGLPTQFS